MANPHAASPTCTLRDRLRRLPKAELHLHLEGTIGPDLLWRLAQQHHLRLGIGDEDACRRLYDFRDFDGFIRLYKAIGIHLADPADYADTVLAMGAQLARQGVVYAEVFFSIGILLWRRVPVPEFFAAAEMARRKVQAETGVEIAWIADGIRQFGADHLERVLDAVEALQSSAIVAIGIGGDEGAGPARWFAAAYERARRMGLHTTVHAGETCGPESIREALATLKPERIGHGLRAVEDAALIAELAAATIALDVCPTSNVKTGCLPDLAAHPLPLYYNSRIPLSLSSDDPGIFGSDLLDEYVIIHDVHGLKWQDLIRLADNSFLFSFLQDAEKRRRRVDLKRAAELLG